MNDTPCPLCNHLLVTRRQAFIKREWAELARLEAEYKKHVQACEVVNSQWYQSLWRNCVVVVTNSRGDEPLAE